MGLSKTRQELNSTTLSCGYLQLRIGSRVANPAILGFPYSYGVPKSTYILSVLKPCFWQSEQVTQPFPHSPTRSYSSMGSDRRSETAVSASTSMTLVDG